MTNNLFTQAKIGTLVLPNRLIRSATVERMADVTGKPTDKIKMLWANLAEGGVGLIITGHMYVHPSGKASPEMAGIYSDSLVPALAECVQAVHNAGGLIIPQINHGGLRCDPSTVEEVMAPSNIHNELVSPRHARAMTEAEIADAILAFGQAARRAKDAGFDGVQIHGAHGYLISQFFSPLTNQRTDVWGGSLENRTRFLREVCAEIRRQVGGTFPVVIKLGMEDGVQGGLCLEDMLLVASQLEEMGIDMIEVSGAMSGPLHSNIETRVKTVGDEAYFRPWAKLVKQRTSLPVSLVGGLRSKSVMEDVLTSGDADFISLCRPLISEPDLPKRLQHGDSEHSRCISATLCYPKNFGEGISCKCNLKK